MDTRWLVARQLSVVTAFGAQLYLSAKISAATLAPHKMAAGLAAISAMERQ